MLPPGLTYLSGLPSEGVWTYPEWNIQRLNVGVVETLVIKAKVDSGTSGTSITNTISNKRLLMNIFFAVLEWSR